MKYIIMITVLGLASACAFVEDNLGISREDQQALGQSLFSCVAKAALLEDFDGAKNCGIDILP